MPRQRARLGGIVLIGLTLTSPMPALATCAPGGMPTYKDVEAIAVRRCGTVGFIYEFATTNDGFLFFRGQFNTPVTGQYTGHDGQALFANLVHILEAGDFFSIRLKDSPTFYIDGPCEKIEVMRCGVLTIVGGLGFTNIPFEADVKDAQTRRLVSLISTMQGRIFAWSWSSEHQEVTPTPSPAPH
jgi:hypothetical protein